MEKPDKGSQDSELDASDVEVTEQMVDEPQKPEDHDNQMQEQIAAEIKAETSNEKSEGLQDRPDYETGEIQPKVEQCDESTEKLQEVSTKPPEMGHEAMSGSCQEPGTSQMAEDGETSEPSKIINFRLTLAKVMDEVMKYHPTEHNEEFLEWINKQKDIPDVAREVFGKCQEPGTSQMEEVAEAEETSKPSNVANFRVTLAKIVNEVMKYHPTEGNNFHEWIKKHQDMLGGKKDMEVEISEPDKQPEAESDLEAESIEESEQPQQELHVQHTEQSMELVLEEAVIYDARQERMEEVENVEEPQKYAFREPSSD